MLRTQMTLRIGEQSDERVLDIHASIDFVCVSFLAQGSTAMFIHWHVPLQIVAFDINVLAGGQ